MLRRSYRAYDKPSVGPESSFKSSVFFTVKIEHYSKWMFTYFYSINNVIFQVNIKKTILYYITVIRESLNHGNTHIII